MNIFKRSIFLSFFAVAGMYAMEGEHENTAPGAKAKLDTVSEAQAKINKLRLENDSLSQNHFRLRDMEKKLKDSPTEEREALQKSFNADKADHTARSKKNFIDMQDAYKNHEEAKAREKLQKETEAKKAPDVSVAMFESLAPEVATKVALKPGEEKLSEEDKQFAIKMKTEIFDKINQIEGFKKNGIDFSSVSDVLDRITKAGKITPQDRANIENSRSAFVDLMKTLQTGPIWKLNETFSPTDISLMNEAIDSMNEISQTMNGVDKITPDDKARALNQKPKEILQDLETAKIGKSNTDVLDFILDFISSVMLAFRGPGVDTYDYVAMNPAIGY